MAAHGASRRQFAKDLMGTLAVLVLMLIRSAYGGQLHHLHRHRPSPYEGNMTVKRHYNHINHHNHNRDAKRHETYKAPQLSSRDKAYLGKLEDALQNKRGRMMYTNSWA